MNKMPIKQPDDFSFITTIILLIFASVGSIAKMAYDIMHGVRVDLIMFICQIIISLFAGLIAVLIAGHYELSFEMAGGMSGMAGWLGAEFTRSATANKYKIDNSIPVNLLSSARNTASKMELIRAALDDKPITITSGYRCARLNRLVGGSNTSYHSKAEAVDFKYHFFKPRDICKRILSSVISFDQLILEYPEDGWVHVSFSVNGDDRYQVLTAVKQQGKTVYLPGLV